MEDISEEAIVEEYDNIIRKIFEDIYANSSEYIKESKTFINTINALLYSIFYAGVEFGIRHGSKNES
jgi:hypothetical protein